MLIVWQECHGLTYMKARNIHHWSLSSTKDYKIHKLCDILTISQSMHRSILKVSEIAAFEKFHFDFGSENVLSFL